MDVAQIGLGLGLLAVSSLTFLEPTVLTSNTVAALTGLALVIGTVATFASVARET
ncbi:MULTISPECIES: hypothetical protein [Natrialba]|uniref:hypothetical protein n=1 Tax=Natrialba TaxID=63742 RepID=UPI00190F9B1C|nr:MULTISPECIES: hypothetical protein [Natrialba]